MSQIFKFRNQQIGDVFIGECPADVLGTPVSIGLGLLADNALFNGDSRNLEYQSIVTISLVRLDQFAFNKAARIIMSLQGLAGRLEIYDGLTLKTWSTTDWFFLQAPKPDKLPGFGGRFIPEWPLVFGGSSPLEDA